MRVAHIHIIEREITTKYLDVDILNFERRRRKFWFHYF